MFPFHLFSSCLPGDNKNMSSDMFLPTFKRSGVDLQCGSRLFDPIGCKHVCFPVDMNDTTHGKTYDNAH